MTELELYKYINDNNIEWHNQSNDGVDDVIIFPHFYEVNEISRLITSFTDDEGMSCILKDGYICLWMKDLCEYYGIEMGNIFKAE